MNVITPSDSHVVTTPNAAMTRLATPSLGSRELAVWRVRLEPGALGPVHGIDREQVWAVLSGTLGVTCDGRDATLSAGDTVVVPPDVMRQFRSAGEAVEAVVSMAHGGVALTPDGRKHPLPWAE
ncbi:hypothetical protein SRB5_44410 [Streptomyces sp. RB5]|uniref:Cupin type-2 domain-containing protein n=1 Tax=Streptomyces smaragdinus TaxID=2585196 RepID=A0A7K0CLB3_9ACTN|nr:cupin domain-containing protein [Streptomyces smaragdinus]MQY14278.1 hypothetical protein [Streptomyces smaragdinus]